MQFSLRVICNYSAMETVRQKTAELTNYLHIPNKLSFEPYWKNEECVVLEISTHINNPNYDNLQQYVLNISGADNLSLQSSPGSWECSYFASTYDLLSNKNIAFVVCSIFENS